MNLRNITIKVNDHLTELARSLRENTKTVNSDKTIKHYNQVLDSKIHWLSGFVEYLMTENR